MKKLFIAALLVVGMTGFSQNNRQTGQRNSSSEIEKFTPEQRNQLMLKKMTLELDLSASQQKEMAKIITEKSAKQQLRMKEMKAMKESNAKPTSDEMFARKNRVLDEKIAMKERMKRILNPEQFKKWETMKSQKHENKNGRIMKTRTMNQNNESGMLKGNRLKRDSIRK